MKPFSLHILTTHKNKDRHKNILDTYLNGFDDYVFYTDIKTEYGNQILLLLIGVYYQMEVHSNECVVVVDL